MAVCDLDRAAEAVRVCEDDRYSPLYRSIPLLCCEHMSRPASKHLLCWRMLDGDGSVSVTAACSRVCA